MAEQLQAQQISQAYFVLRNTQSDNRRGHWLGFLTTILAMVCALCRTTDRIDSARVRRPYRRLGRDSPAPDPENLCLLLQQDQNAPVIG